MTYELITRIHINGKNSDNSWSKLGKYLKKDITVLEDTKALIRVSSMNYKSMLKKKIKMYNEQYHTDFSIE